LLPHKDSCFNKRRLSYRQICYSRIWDAAGWPINNHIGYNVSFIFTTTGIMMSTLAELVKQRQALDAQIEQARQTEIADALGKVKALVAEYSLTAQDIFGASKRGPKAAGASKNPVAPKYRDAGTGQTWTGRGKAPKWIEGKDRAQFVI
jgi:DNA-binding protein H-NS